MFNNGIIIGAIGPCDHHPFLGINIDFETMKIKGPSEYVIWNHSDKFGARYFLVHNEYHNDGSIGISIRGIIMINGTKIPDPKKFIVHQPAPGLFLTDNWSYIGSQIRHMTRHESNRAVSIIACFLTKVSYVPKFDFMAPQFANSSEIIELISKLAEQQEVPHETNHMKSIFELMDMLEPLTDNL